MLSHPLTRFEIENYYQNEPIFKGFYTRNNMHDKIMEETHVINLDEYSDIGNHWIVFYALNNSVSYFDSFWVEQIPKEIKKFIDTSTVVTNIFRIQANDSIMCGYFCIGFIDFMLSGKTLTEFTNPFSPNNFQKNDDIILNYFTNNV